LDSASNSAASDKGHTGALYSKNSDPAAEVGMELFTTALGLYGGVLWSGELQGFIIHETSMKECLPSSSSNFFFDLRSSTSDFGLRTSDFFDFRELAGRRHRRPTRRD
jgi:hypothetical protein